MPNEVQLIDDHKQPGSLSGLAAYCQDLYQEYSNSQYRKDKLEEISEGRKRYAGTRDPKSFPWEGCSNKSMMLTAIAVDNLEPRIKAGLIADDDFIFPQPVGAEDVQYVDAVKEFMHWALLNNMHIEELIRPFIHDLLLDGTKDVIPLWEEKQRINFIREMKPVFVGPEGQPIEIPPEFQQLHPEQLMQMGIRQAGMADAFSKREESDFKVALELIDLNDSFFPDTGDDFEEQPYLRFIYPTLYELKELSGDKGPYKNITDDLVIDPARQGAENQDEVKQDKGVKHSEYTREVKLLECYVKWQGDWVIVTFAVDSAWQEVRRQPISEVYWHSRKPVRRFRLFSETKESMGTGIPKKVEHFATGVDDLYNQMVDSGTVEILSYFFYNETGGFEKVKLKIFPGAGIPIPKDSNVTFPNQSGGVKSPQFISFINLLLAFFEKMINLSDYTLGRESETSAKGGQTARGMSMIIQEGNISHSYRGETLQDQFSKLLTDILTLYAQYLPLDAKKRVFQDNKWVFQPIDVMSLQGNYDLRLKVSDASANKSLNRREKIELFNANRENPVSNLVKSTEDLYKAFGIKDTREYIKPEFAMIVQAMKENPELPQIIQQYLQQKQQQGMDQETTKQAQQNIRRQAIQREVEANAGEENRKLQDQVREGLKRGLIKEKMSVELGVTALKEREKLAKEVEKAQEKLVKEQIASAMRTGTRS